MNHFGAPTREMQQLLGKRSLPTSNEEILALLVEANLPAMSQGLERADSSYPTSRPSEFVVAQNSPIKLPSIERLELGVFAFAFCPPDGEAAQQLLKRKKYFNTRTGDVWDLCFAGYLDPTHKELARDAEPFGAGWSFSASAFNSARDGVTKKTRGKWAYSGESELVIMISLSNAHHFSVDWKSLVSISLDGRSLGEVVEQVSGHIEASGYSPDYGCSLPVRGRLVTGNLCKAAIRTVATVAVTEAVRSVFGLI